MIIGCPTDHTEKRIWTVQHFVREAVFYLRKLRMDQIILLFDTREPLSAKCHDMIVFDFPEQFWYIAF